MKTRPISDPKDLESSWEQQYSRLAKEFARMLPKTRGVLVEIGCGKGQLTIPLAKTIPGSRIIALDRDSSLDNYWRGKIIVSFPPETYQTSTAISECEMRE